MHQLFLSSHGIASHDLPLLTSLLLLLLMGLLSPLRLTTQLDFALNVGVVLSLTNEQTTVIVH